MQIDVIITYEYDAEDNLTRITYPLDAEHSSGKQVNYTYNARNQLETVTDWADRVTTYHYDRAGRLIGITRPNGTACVIELDAAGQPLSQRETSAGRLFHYQKFKYDLAGQIEEKFTARGAHEREDPAFAATYDVDNRLLTVNGQSVTHDNDGNMTLGPITAESGNVTLSYNARNQLTSAAGVTYTYDAEGRRRTMTDAGGTSRYTIDPNGALSRLLVRHAPDGARTYYVYGLGLLYEATKSGTDPETTITYHFDQAGSTVVRTDDLGRDVGRAEYSPYGDLTWQNGDMNTPFLYNGRYGVMTDPNDLLHMRARYYSPDLKRFLNADPIGLAAGPNLYAYCDGDPISRLDPDGQFWFLIGAAIGGGLDYAAQVTSNYASGQTGSAAWTNVNLISIGFSAAGGALTGGIGGIVSNQVATVARRAVINGVANAFVSANVQVAKNAAGVNGASGQEDVFSGMGNSAAWGAITGVGASLVGDAIEGIAAYGTAAYRSTAWNSGSLASKQFATGGSVTVNSSATGWVRPTAVAVGGGISNSISNWPWNPLPTSSTGKKE